MVRIATVLEPLQAQFVRATKVARRGLARGKQAVGDATRASRRLLHR